MQKNNRYYNTPSIVLEVPGCNLRCMFGNKICPDALVPSKLKYTENDVKKFIQKNSHIHHLVITGGEPLQYKKELEKLLNSVWREDMIVTIFTNGTLPILNPLTEKYKVSLYVVDFVQGTMPKIGSTIFDDTDAPITLGTSDIKSLENIISERKKSLQRLCMYSSDYLLLIAPENDVDNQIQQLKESISQSEDEFVQHHFEKYPIDEHIVLIANTVDRENSVKDICKRKGYKFNIITKI